MNRHRPKGPWFIAGTTLGVLLIVAANARRERGSAPEASSTPAAAEAPAPAPTPLPAWSLAQPPGPAELDARIASWLALDPAASPHAERALGLRALLVFASPEQLASLADRLARRGGPDDPRWFGIVVARWTETAPDAVARWTATPGAADRLPAGVFALAREQAALAWARVAFDSAYAWALAQPDRDSPQGLAARLLGLLAETDSGRALALADARGAETAGRLLRPIFEAWARRDPESAVRTLAPRLLAANVSCYDLAETFKAWLQKSPDAALGWFRTQPALAEWSTDEHGFPSSLASFRDRLASVDAVLRLTDPELKYRMLSGMLAYGWPVDKEQAAGLIDKLDDPELRARLIRDANRSTPVEHPENALPFALRLPPGTERDARLTDLTSRWAQRDPVAALNWLKAHDEPAVAAAVQAAALGAIARDEPQTALATWATLAAGPARDQAVEQIARGWAGHDPAGAAAWLATQPGSGTVWREANWDTSRAIMQTWVPRDADAALAWSEARFGATKDVIPLYVWAESISQTLPPAEAGDRIGRITDLPTRHQTLYNHVHRWLRSDFAAASAWLSGQSQVAPAAARSWIEDARKEISR